LTSTWQRAVIPWAKPLRNLSHGPRAYGAAVQRLIYPFRMNKPEFGFLQTTESIEYFLPLLRPERRQEPQDFGFAHA
jgi:hypothetical protein